MILLLLVRVMTLVLRIIHVLVTLEAWIHLVVCISKAFKSVQTLPEAVLVRLPRILTHNDNVSSGIVLSQKDITPCLIGFLILESPSIRAQILIFLISLSLLKHVV